MVVKQAEFKKVEFAKELKAFLEENADIHDGTYRFKDCGMHSGNLHFWDNPYFEAGLAGGYIRNIDANGRLRICKQQESIGPSAQKSRPQHVLYDDSALMDRVSGFFRQAFGQDILFDFRGGSRLPIHVGKRSDPNLVDRVGDAYVRAVRLSPLLDQQGDGMKS